MPPPPPPLIHPIPDAQLPWVFGLLEMLEDRGGREDGYKIARDLSFKFSDLLKVMKAAEILGLVSTPAGDVVLEPLGREFLAADMNARKRIIREQLRSIRCSATSCGCCAARKITRSPRKWCSNISRCSCRTSGRNGCSPTMVGWGRFAELFGYNKDDDRFYLDEEADKP